MESRWLLYYTTTRSQGNQFQVYRECFLAKKFLLRGQRSSNRSRDMNAAGITGCSKISKKAEVNKRFQSRSCLDLGITWWIYTLKMKCAYSASNMRLFPSWIQVLIEHVNASGLGLTIGAVAPKQPSDTQSWYHCHHMSPPPRILLNSLWFFGFTGQPSSKLPRSCRHYFTTVFGTWPSAKLVCFIPLKDPENPRQKHDMTGAFAKSHKITSWLPLWFWRRGIYMKSQNSPEPKAGMMIMGEMLRWWTLFFWRMLLLTCVLPVGSQSLLADDMLMLSLLESPWFIIFHCQTLVHYGKTRGISEGKWWNLQHPLWSLAESTQGV